MRQEFLSSNGFEYNFKGLLNITFSLFRFLFEGEGVFIILCFKDNHW